MQRKSSSLYPFIFHSLVRSFPPYSTNAAAHTARPNEANRSRLEIISETIFPPLLFFSFSPRSHFSVFRRLLRYLMLQQSQFTFHFLSMLKVINCNVQINKIPLFTWSVYVLQHESAHCTLLASLSLLLPTSTTPSESYFAISKTIG